MTVPARIYLDHNAGAPLRPEARAAMLAVLDAPANPSSAHREGARARRLLEDARAEVAALIGAAPAEIVFTSGATEANNLALRGVVRPGERVVTVATEHASILETAAAIGDAVVVGVDATGRVDEPALRAAAAGQGVRLVSVGLANGEVGVVAPAAAIAASLRRDGLVVHTDAAQAAGRIPIDVRALGVDLLSLSSHKLGGPVGAGALWVRAGVRLEPQLTGGPQERDRRAGTENVAAIAGFAAAARSARVTLAGESGRQSSLRDRLWEVLQARVPDVERNGPAGDDILPNTLNVRFAGCAGESLLVLLDLAGVAVSLGSACAAGGTEPSHVLRAMGRDDRAARDGVRFSLGATTTAAEIDRVIEIVPQVVADVRRRAAA